MTHDFANTFLQGLSPAALLLLRPHLECVELPARMLLFDENAEPAYVHFMEDGIASVVSSMLSGQTVEVLLTGRECFPEKLHLLGPGRGSSRCFVQMSGDAMRMNFHRFQQIFLQNEEIRSSVLHCVQYEALALQQVSACNRLHQIDARLARWLLMVLDRIDGCVIRTTQEFLGEMLGVGRPTLNVALKQMERAGHLRVMRAGIEVVDRAGLEKEACECYAVIRVLFDGLKQRAG